jgi:hypothetical protein
MWMLFAMISMVSLAAPAGTAESAKKADDKIICKGDVNVVTGTRYSRPKKVCLRAWEWRQRADETNRTMRGLQDGRAEHGNVRADGIPSVNND